MSADGESSAGAGAEIARLEKYCEQLEDAIDELEHDARRCRDKLERAGGDSHGLSRELDRLKRNSAYNRKELEAARRRIHELESVSR